MKWFLIAFQKYAVFKGRASRQEYWMFVLFSVILSIATALLDMILDTHYYAGYFSMGYINNLCQLVLLVPSVSVTVRRLHDVGKNRSLLIWLGIVSALLTWAYVPFLQNLNSGISPDSGSVLIIVLLFVAFFALSIWMLVLFCREGDRFDNKFGPDPQAAENPQFAMNDMKLGSFAQNVPPLLPVEAGKFTNNFNDASAVPAHTRSNKNPLAGFIVSFSRLETGEFWELREGNNAIGSASESQVRLLEKHVSDKHANINVSIDKQNNCWKLQIVDLSAANGTELNGERLPIFSGHEIKDGDKIKAGGYELTLMVIGKVSK